MSLVPRPTRALALALLAALLLPGAAWGADALRRGVDPGDHVTFHVTARDADGAVVYTTDAALAAAEVAAGNARLVPPEDAPDAYRPRAAFLLPSDGADGRLDPVAFLMGRRAGDVVRTPLVPNPLEERPAARLPSVVAVSPRFALPVAEAEAYLAAGGGTDAAFLYAGEFPARILERNGTHALVEVALATGDVVASRTLGFAFAVERAGADEVALRPLLAPGERFAAAPCALDLGVPPGRYVVRDVSRDGALVAPDEPRDRLAAVREVAFEFTILAVEEWPELYRARLLAELRARDAWRSASVVLGLA